MSEQPAVDPFPPPASWPAADLVGVGGPLDVTTVLAAYRAGLFPMPVDVEVGARGRGLGFGRRRSMSATGWWSPDPRGVLPLDGLRKSRSLRAACRRLRVRVDATWPDGADVFDTVVERCADPARPHGWITPQIRAVYGELRRLGCAHSVTAWTADGQLAGGLYGVAIGGLFAGESMFHDPRPFGRDASKVALVGLVALLRQAEYAADRVLDVQWVTPHLASLGAVEISRRRYLQRLAVAVPLPSPFPGPVSPSGATPATRGNDHVG